MLIATAIEIPKTTALLSGCFAKAKYYAFFNGRDINIKKNPYTSGIKVRQWLIEAGVTHLLIKEQDKKPCAFKTKDEIMLLYPEKATNIRLDEIVRLYFKYL
jgi:hypothetical protein